MKIIVSSDRQRIVNFEQIHGVYIDVSTDTEIYMLYAHGGWEISIHKQLENAKKQLQEIVSIMTADGPIVYQAEDTE